MERKLPLYNLKYTNEVSNWTNAGFSYMKPEAPSFVSEEKNTKIKKFLHSDIGAEVIVRETSYDNTVAIRQENEIIKTSDSELSLTQFSSAMISGIKFENFDDFIVHYTDSAWQTECQWKKFSLTNLGFHPGGNHGMMCVKKFSSIGTFSTGTHYPLIFLEDKKNSQIYFIEIETSTNWMIEIGIREIEGENLLYLECNSAYENFDCWYLNMKKNDSYKASPAVVGCVKGGFNEAVNELLKYKRAVSEKSFGKEIPVVFNDYMNCIWSAQKKEKLISLIDAAKEAGADIFCMDAGWYDFVGDWNIKEENFGDIKLQGIIDYIKLQGMKAGIWLEIEAAVPKSEAYKKFYDSVYKLHGLAINGEYRAIMDFRNESFRNHITAVIDKLYKMGIRYIKNDFNKSSGIGIDGDNCGKCPSYELREASLAFYDYIKELYKKYPDLILENCASGGMRNDGGILKYFSIASTSDLEYYRYYPSVMIGTNACVPIEKSGIWAYPYPQFLSEKEKNDDEVFSKEYINQRKDGRETVFNMVTSMFGCMYLSGRIDKCDEYNFSLVREAVKVYKSYRSMINKAYPMFFEYPLNTSDSYITSFGLYNPEEKTLLIGIWNYNGNNNYSINLEKYLYESSKAELIYPKDSSVNYSIKNKNFNIIFHNNIDAAVIKINL